MSDTTTLGIVPTEKDIAHIKHTSVSLGFLLFQVAEHEAARLRKLIKYAKIVEEEIFDEQTLVHLTDDQKIERYKLALSIMQNSTTTIKSTLGTMNIDDLQTQLLLLENTVTDVNEDTNSIKRKAASLLQTMVPSDS